MSIIIIIIINLWINVKRRARTALLGARAVNCKLCSSVGGRKMAELRKARFGL